MSEDKLLGLIDNVKLKLTDLEYKDMMDELQTLHQEGVGHHTEYYLLSYSSITNIGFMYYGDDDLELETKTHIDNNATVLVKSIQPSPIDNNRVESILTYAIRRGEIGVGDIPVLLESVGNAFLLGNTLPTTNMSPRQLKPNEYTTTVFIKSVVLDS